MEKIYCGSAKVVETKFGKVLKLSLRAEDVEKLQENLTNDWVNVWVNKRKEASESGFSHYLTVDTWENKPANRTEEPSSDDESEELPF